jgi:hypothetical protein
MNRPNSVIFNLAQGEVRIAGTIVVPVGGTGTPGEIETDGGTILRPLTFGERTRIVGRSGVDVPAVCQSVLRTSRVRAGADSPRVLEILALALAGGDQAAAPPFAEAMLQVAGASGWSLSQINDAEAAEIDGLAVFLTGPIEPPLDDGWNRIVFQTGPAETNSGGDVLEQVRYALANQLLQRAGANRDPEPGAGPISNSTWPSRFQYHRPAHHQESSGSESPSNGNRSTNKPTPIDPGAGGSGAPKPRFQGRIPDGNARPGLAENGTAPASKPGQEDSARPALDSRDARDSNEVGPRNEPAPVREQDHQSQVQRPRGYIRIQTQGDSSNSFRRPSQEQLPAQVGDPGRISAAFIAPGPVNWRPGPAPGPTGPQPFRAGSTGAASGSPVSVSSPDPTLARSGPAELMVPPAAPDLGPRGDTGPAPRPYSNLKIGAATEMLDGSVAAAGPGFQPEDLADTLADILGWEADLRGLAQ